MSSDPGFRTHLTSTSVKRTRRIIGELLGVLAVLSLSAVAIAQMVSGAWANYLFYNGDSVVLPLIEQSIAAGDDFEWVFSSQLFLFPEAILFALSSVFTDDPRAALLVNAFVNVLCLYAILRSIAAQFGGATRAPARWQIAATVCASAVFLFYVVLEPAPDINRTSVASLFLLTTYYYGSVLAGLGLFSLTLWFVRDNADATRFGLKSTTVYALSTLSIGGLAATSNPLFMLQYVAPVLALVVVLALFRAMKWRSFLVVAVTHILIVPLSTFGRSLLSSFVSADVSDYLQFDMARESMRVIWATIRACFQTERGTLELILAGLVLGLSCYLFVRGLYRRTRPTHPRQTPSAELFAYGFSSLSAVILVAGFVVTGSMTTRYLMPLVIFPLVGLLAALITVVVPVARKWPRSRRYPVLRPLATLVIMALVGAAGIWGSVSITRAIAAQPYTYAACLDAFRGDESRDGVASFWVARQLQLYQDSAGLVVQVAPDLDVDPWMINLALYENRDFNFVIVQHESEADNVVEILGEPSEAIDCGEYDILDYESAPGEEKLNSIIEDSLSEVQGEHGFSGDSSGVTP